MKRLLALLLALTMTLGLCACNGSGEEKNPAAEGLQTGYARESIMPEETVNMAGYGNQAHRLSTGYKDILYASCVAASENGTTVLMFSLDLLRPAGNWTEEFREKIATATGIPGANIMFCATHTHSAPAPGGSEPQVLKWKVIAEKALLTAASKALADLAPTTMYAASVDTENMTYVRHYIMHDGTYSGDNFGDRTKMFKDHATVANEEMLVLKMDREGEKKDIVLMNFQAHPCFVGGGTTLSSDFIGATRNKFEEQTDSHFIYFTGSAGNQNTTSRLSTDNAVSKQGMDAYAEALVKYAVDALPNAKKVESTGVKIVKKQFTYASNNLKQDQLDQAKEVANLHNSTGDGTAADSLARQYGFDSVFEAKGIVNCSKYPPTQTMELNAIVVGGVGFVTTPCELFSNTGLFIRENSPYEYTVLMSLANEELGYFPTKEAYEYSCYESWSSRCASGIAEAMADELVSMLKGL